MQIPSVQQSLKESLQDPRLSTHTPRPQHTIIAFDPGSNHTRYAVLRGNKHEQHYISSGTIPSEPKHLERLFNTLNGIPADGYAVETMGRFAPKPQIMLSLLKTAEIAGALIGLATSTGKPVFTMPANAPKGKTSWRVLLCGARDGEHAGDNTVKYYLKIVLPSLPAKCDEHERDAAGLGVVALMSDMQNPDLFYQNQAARAGLKP